MNPDLTGLNQLVNDLTDSFRSLATQMQSLSSSLQRMATAGLSATTEGNRLSFVWQLFTRQIASAVLPAIHFLIDGLSQLTQWFKSLSGDAQGLILKIGLVVAATAVLVPLFSLLRTILTPINIVLGILVSALAYFFTETDTGKKVLDAMSEALQWAMDNWIAIKNVFEMVVGAISRILMTVAAGFIWLGIQIMSVIESILDYIPGTGDAIASIAEFRKKSQEMLNGLVVDINKPIELSTKETKSRTPRGDVNPAGFAFESLSASFERITAAANKTDLARESLDVQKKQLEAQNKIWESIEKNGLDGGAGGGDY